MKWSQQASTEDMIQFVNKSPNCIKVLAAEDLLNSKEEKSIVPKKCEGVFVYRLDGDDENGIGILLSNIVSIEHPAGRGDLVHYRTLHPDNKPYITQWHDGSGN